MWTYHAGLVTISAAICALPSFLITWFFDSASDKPWEPHANTLSYVKIAAVSFVVATIIWAIARDTMIPDDYHCLERRCFMAAFTVSFFMMITFCMFGTSWVMAIKSP